MFLFLPNNLIMLIILQHYAHQKHVLQYIQEKVVHDNTIIKRHSLPLQRLTFLGSEFVDDEDDDECLHLPPRPQLLRTLRFLFNTDDFGANKMSRTEACQHTIRTHPTKYDHLHEPRKTPEKLSAIYHCCLYSQSLYTRVAQVKTAGLMACTQSVFPKNYALC